MHDRLGQRVIESGVHCRLQFVIARVVPPLTGLGSRRGSDNVVVQHLAAFHRNNFTRYHERRHPPVKACEHPLSHSRPFDAEQDHAVRAKPPADSYRTVFSDPP